MLIIFGTLRVNLPSCIPFHRESEYTHQQQTTQLPEIKENTKQTKLSQCFKTSCGVMICLL